MAIRNIRLEGDEILRKKSKPVETIDEKVQILIDDMIETLHQQNGVGLAAVQVGVLKRIIVIDTYEGDPVLVLINPQIIKKKGEQIVEEGCLSYPNKFAKVVRPEEVTVEALDRNGNKIKVTGKELLAQTLAHETDHLDGKLFMDIILPGTLEMIKPEE